MCFFKQKTAYEMRISDWSSDVCSSDLSGFDRAVQLDNEMISNACPPLLQVPAVEVGSVETLTFGGGRAVDRYKLGGFAEGCGAALRPRKYAFGHESLFQAAATLRAPSRAARKSVVSGKRETERGDQGGRLT